MTTRRFALAWIFATAVPFWLGELVREPWLSWAHERFRLNYWAPIVPLYLTAATAAALLQSRCLSRERRAVPGWRRAALIGHLIAALVFVSGKSQWIDVLGSFGAVKLPAWWFWTFAAGIALSCCACVAAAEAWVLRDQGLRRRWPLWIAGRTGVALALLVAMLVLGRYPLVPIAASRGYYTLWGGAAGAAVWHVTSAATTAWMLDAWVFRLPGGEGRDRVEDPAP